MEQRSPKLEGLIDREGSSLSLDQLRVQLKRQLQQPLRRDTFLHSGEFVNPDKYSGFSSGIEELDELLGGGFPTGKLTELGGNATSGRTSLALTAAAFATRQNHFVAWIDVNDSLDPHCVQQAGMAAERFIWLRFREANFERQAFKAAEEVIRGQSFRLLIFDLVGKRRIADRSARWIRLKRVLRETPMVCLVLSDKKQLSLGADLMLFCRGQSDRNALGNKRLCAIEIRRQRYAAPGRRVTLSLEPFVVA